MPIRVKHPFVLGALAVAVCCLAVACGQPAGTEESAAGSSATPATESGSTSPARAVAHLEATADNEVAGSVVFEAVEGGVRVTADLTGLTEGLHGIHIHANGDCSAPDGTSAGGHFNPDNTPHGAPDKPASERHVGDLGNIEAGPDGTAHYERVDPLLAMTGDHGIVGRAVIVHADADDLTSQPTGAAGARVACGVIEAEQG